MEKTLQVKANDTSTCKKVMIEIKLNFAERYKGSAAQQVINLVAIPYIKGTSEAIKWVPICVLGPHSDLRINTQRRILVHPKDPVPKQERVGVVYHIPCNNCPQAYIGQTSRTLTQRPKEHQRAVRNGDLATSALAKHAH